MWSSIKNCHGHTKTNQKLKEDLYNCILQHTQFFQSPIENGYICVYIDVKSKKTLVPKFLFQVSVRELHNSMVISPEEGGLKEAKYSDNNIIINYSTLHNILPPQLTNISLIYKFICSCVCCIYCLFDLKEMFDLLHTFTTKITMLMEFFSMSNP